MNPIKILEFLGIDTNKLGKMLDKKKSGNLKVSKYGVNFNIDLDQLKKDYSEPQQSGLGITTFGIIGIVAGVAILGLIIFLVARKKAGAILSKKDLDWILERVKKDNTANQTNTMMEIAKANNLSKAEYKKALRYLVNNGVKLDINKEIKKVDASWNNQTGFEGYGETKPAKKAEKKPVKKSNKTKTTRKTKGGATINTTTTRKPHIKRKKTTVNDTVETQTKSSSKSNSSLPIESYPVFGEFDFIPTIKISKAADSDITTIAKENKNLPPSKLAEELEKNLHSACGFFRVATGKMPKRQGRGRGRNITVLAINISPAKADREAKRAFLRALAMRKALKQKSPENIVLQRLEPIIESKVIEN